MIDGENKVNHGFLRRQITILLEDSRTVCECVSDWSVEIRDDRFQERPCGICYGQELILAKCRGQMGQVWVLTVLQSSRRWIQATCSRFLDGWQRWRWYGLGGRVGDWFCGEGATTEETSIMRRAKGASDDHCKRKVSNAQNLCQR